MSTIDDLIDLMSESEELTRRLAGVQRQINIIYPEVPGEFLEPRNVEVDARGDSAGCETRDA